MENKNTENSSLESKLYTAEEIAIILGVSRSTAYRVIKRLNAEVEKKGYITSPVKFLNAPLTKEHISNKNSRGVECSSHFLH